MILALGPFFVFSCKICLILHGLYIGRLGVGMGGGGGEVPLRGSLYISYIKC